MVKTMTILARPEIRLEAPILIWWAKEPNPDFGALAYTLANRWTEPVRLTSAVIATAEAGNLFGGTGGRAPRTSETTHDLCLSAVYLRLRSKDPRRASRWVTEAKLFERGEGRSSRLPDAFIDGRGSKTVVEFGGAYRKEKLQDFHDFCADKGWGYELW